MESSKDNVDSYSDRYSRTFMVRTLILVGLAMIAEYLTKNLNCSYEHIDSKHFVESFCWSSGLFIYEEMKSRPFDTKYYGIPKYLHHDGLNPLNEICTTVNRQFHINPECAAMNRIYYKQYIWLPFYVVILSCLFYIPYTLFKMANVDLISLNNLIHSSSFDNNADAIVRNYFNYSVNPISRLRLNIWLNILVKLVYLIVNVFAFSFTSYMLNGKFESYGRDFQNWSNSNKTMAAVHPGTALLPTTAICEVRDIRHSAEDQLVLCQVPSNAFYQYAMLLLWFLFVVGIFMAVLGVLLNFGFHLYRFLCYGNAMSIRKIHSFLTLREIEYLVLIKKVDVVLYGEVMRLLKEVRTDEDGKNFGWFEMDDDMVSRV